MKTDLSDEEKEAEIQKKIEEKKLKRKKYAEKAKEQKCLAKKAKNDELEKHLWDRFELNSKFLAIDERKNENKNKIKKIL